MSLWKTKKKYRINIKIIEYHLNIIAAMNEWLTRDILESNVRKRQKCKISLEHEVGKLQNMNK
jgi:hypothetical protein